MLEKSPRSHRQSILQSPIVDRAAYDMFHELLSLRQELYFCFYPATDCRDNIEAQHDKSPPQPIVMKA